MPVKNDNPFLNLIINIILPSFILMKFSGPELLGPVAGLVIALLFPFSFGIFGLIKDREINIFSIIGLISITLTGVFGLLSLDVKWIIIKETGIPLILGFAVLLSQVTAFPVIEKILINDRIFNIKEIYLKLAEKKNTGIFEKQLKISGYLLAGSFFLSGLLNNYLARTMLISAPGTASFNKELGLMTAYSFPVIAVPSMLIMIFIFIYIIRGIRVLTGLKFSEILIETN